MNHHVKNFHEFLGEAAVMMRGEKHKHGLGFADLTVGDEVEYDNRPWKVSKVGEDFCFITFGTQSKRIGNITAVKPLKIQSQQAK